MKKKNCDLYEYCKFFIRSKVLVNTIIIIRLLTTVRMAAIPVSKAEIEKKIISLNVMVFILLGPIFGLPSMKILEVLSP